MCWADNPLIKRAVMRSVQPSRYFALVLSLAVHLLVAAGLALYYADFSSQPGAPAVQEHIIFLDTELSASAASQPPQPLPERLQPSLEASAPDSEIMTQAVAGNAATTPAFMQAPPAPSAQDWALAATYTLKNSKRYRYNWGQQVRSMMGTAIQGPDQGDVRFRIEIAPDGRLARLETLWSTSDVAEQRARKAIEHMPPLPPTPTGKPLIFERTISFQPYDTGWPPSYQNDCLPDPPAFANPFAWDGKSPQMHRAAKPDAAPDPAQLQECLKQLPEETLDSVSGVMKRQFEQWDSGQR